MTSPRTPDRAGFPFWRITGCLVLFMLVRNGLRLFGFGRTFTFLGRFVRRKPPGEGEAKISLPEARRTTDLVQTANLNYSLTGASCLVESLTLWWLLRRRAIQADLRLGIRTITGNFESHAWVELDGVVLNDIESVGQIYAPLDLSNIPPGITMR